MAKADKYNEYKEFVEKIMKEHSLDCYVTFTADCHLNEYIGAEDQRVKMLTAFSGSNGTAITCSEPALLTDSRYYIQAKNESSYPLFIGTLSEYLVRKEYKRISFDTNFISAARFALLEKKLLENKIEFISTPRCITPVYRPSKLIDLEQISLSEFITEKSAEYLKKLGFDCPINNNEGTCCAVKCKNMKYKSNGYTHYKSNGYTHDNDDDNKDDNKHDNKHDNDDDNKYDNDAKDFNDNSPENVTGSFYQEKIQKIRELCEGTVIFTELDTIAWIMNLRASDIEYNPIFYSYLVISKNKVILFTDHTVENRNVEIRRYSDFYLYVEQMESGDVFISGDCPQALYAELCKNKSLKIEKTEKIRMLQAVKNNVELMGMALAYFYDGIALTNLFGLLENMDSFTEEDVAQYLEKEKRMFKGYVGPSFETIAGSGENSAIVHHSCTARRAKLNEVLLLDSGSQYYFGTTDTTRTVVLALKTNANENIDINNNQAESNKNESNERNEYHSAVRKDFTLVFKGQLKAMNATYAKDAKFSELDLHARHYMQQEEKDFNHATGHGVGHFLCVHEAPPTVYPKSEDKITENMVFSIEPGYYLENKYGIRIENLVFSRRKSNEIVIVNMTMVPYHLALIDMEMMNEEEKEYLNEFNSFCRWLLESEVNENGRSYLLRNTEKVN
ncbi:Xaa-Pro aminopeptidase [Enteropsectra breve]|nr:Xaa-Pro aminopeptidase [Enteropsectra breve]